MKWILVERGAGVILAGYEDTYLDQNDSERLNSAWVVTFETNQSVETHRRKLKHHYNWVAITAAHWVLHNNNDKCHGR